ncbi:MAG TPA: hypothetical protein VG013_22085 [Gemmataceae bacterium]|jgi:hypothetical protein|nr:hypothetical protein [Gemmataceae bacterium]
MAAAVLTPRVRLMAICDGVRESKTEAGVFHVKGLRQRIVARTFPFVPLRLRLFLVFANPRPGEFPGYVLVINDKTDKTILYGDLSPHPNFEVNEETVVNVTRLRCSFPQPGRYTVQVWFFQEQGPDVLKGELPFAVSKEGASP